MCYGADKSRQTDRQPASQISAWEQIDDRWTDDRWTGREILGKCCASPESRQGRRLPASAQRNFLREAWTQTRSIVRVLRLGGLNPSSLKFWCVVGSWFRMHEIAHVSIQQNDVRNRWPPSTTEHHICPRTRIKQPCDRTPELHTYYSII